MAEARERRTASALRQAGLMAGLALCLAALAWGLRPDRLPLAADPVAYRQDLAAPLVDVDEALSLYEAGGHVFVDTRPVDPERVPHIPGAFPLRPHSLDEDLRAAADFIYPGDPLVLYGTGDLLPTSAVAARLLERGYDNLLIMAGGLPAWRRAGGPVSEPAPAAGAES